MEANGRVRLPEELTKELLAMALPSHDCETIGGEHIQVGGGGQKVVSLVLDPLILDYADGLRPPRLSDVTSHTRLGDALPLVNTTYKMDQGLEGMTLLESNVRSVCEFLSNTTRHVAASPADRTSLRIWIEMIEVALDGATLAERPIASLGAHMKTPLRLPEHECEVIAEATARAIPFSVGSCPMAGATSPFTLAGTLMLTVAETAFMACAVQACRPSHPLLARSSMFPFNMKSGNVSAGGIETSLLEAGNAQLMRQMKLPVGGTCTFNEPRRIDFQSGLETAFKCLSYVLSDTDVNRKSCAPTNRTYPARDGMRWHAAPNWTSGGYGGGHCPSWINDGTGPNGQPYVFFDRAGRDHLVYDDIRQMNIRTNFTMTFFIRPRRYSETGTDAGSSQGQA